MRKGLMALCYSNKGKGEFRAEGNTLFVYDVIVSSAEDAAWFGGADAETFNKTLAAMTGDVVVRLNTPGGDVFAGVAMANAIRSYSGKVTVQVDGYAASAGSLLVAAADEAEIAPGGMVMIHKAWTIAMGNADDFISTASLLEQIDAGIVAAYAAKAGDAVDWPAAMAAETWYSADEAVAVGLVDRIAAGKDKEKMQSRAFDLSAYAKAPKAEPVEDAAQEIAAATETPPPAAEVGSDEIERRRQIARLALITPA
jgi:ATP-dependent Clp protease protease subunit